MTRASPADIERRRRPWTKPNSEVRGWLTAMQTCVRECDFEGARELFSPDVVAFGTLAPIAEGVEQLERDQWREVWTRTSGFRFELDEVRTIGFEQGVCVAAPWRSLGVRPDDSTFERRGRATLVLLPVGGRLVAVHSHFSLRPRGEP